MYISIIAPPSPLYMSPKVYSLSEAFKRALFEKIEDEYDLVIGEEAYCEYIANRKKSRPIAELWKECDI